MLVDTGWYRECRHAPFAPSPHAHQGISPWWSVSASPLLAGQHLLIEDLPDGVYWIAITVNAAGPGELHLQERTTTNNTSYRRVQLVHGGGHVEVRY